jgi:hypothetical protein
MSYHYPQRHSVPRSSQPQQAVPTYPLVPMTPLSGAMIAPPRPLLTRRQMLMIAAVILVVAALWWMNQREVKAATPNRSRMKKQSTKEMAKNLYKRLENRGGANDTTMRSLRSLGAERKP